MITSKLPLLQLTLTGLLLFLQSTIVYAQISGCKDPAANNYNPAATINDGSCTYNTTFYTPPVKVDPLSPLLDETSGLQMAGGFLWSFNDGLNAAAIYRIDTLSNAILQTINLGGATNVDWEDIGFDSTNFYIGDFGNNTDGARTDLKIYKFPLSAIASDYITNPTVTVPFAQIEVINFSYSDQGTPVATAANNTKWDCEAMIVDAGKIHLFSKNWIDVNTTHYVINGTTAGTYSATPLETLATGYLVTAADKSPGVNVAALLGYQATGFGGHFMHLLSDFNGGLFFNGNRRRIDLPNVATMGQAEGICFRTATYGYISNERFSNIITIDQKLRSFNTAAFTPAYVLPLQLKSFTAQNQNGKQVVSWSFASPVNDLQLLHSSNGISFQALKNNGASAEGSFVHQAVSATNCYKLAWRQHTGSQAYSNIICADGKPGGSISNVVLHGGRLSFISNSIEPDSYLFQLRSIDGRILAQTQQRITAAGLYTVSFAGSLAGNELILVEMIGRKAQCRRLVRVTD